jgi:hypothetical protein
MCNHKMSGMPRCKKMLAHWKSLDSSRSAAVLPKQASLKPNAENTSDSMAGGAATEDGRSVPALVSSLTAEGFDIAVSNVDRCEGFISSKVTIVVLVSSSCATSSPRSMTRQKSSFCQQKRWFELMLLLSVNQKHGRAFACAYFIRVSCSTSLGAFADCWLKIFILLCRLPSCSNVFDMTLCFKSR